jgi:hypothetical protein
MRIPRKWLTIRRQMITVACAGLYFAMIAWMIAPPDDEMPPLPPPSLQPQLGVADPISYIGSVSLMTTFRHSWLVENSGQVSLQMWQEDQHDCGLAPCTLDEIQVEDPSGGTSSTRDRHARITIAPGGRALIIMRWETRRTVGVAYSWLDFATDDPKTPRIRLGLVGDILAAEPPPEKKPIGVVSRSIGRARLRPSRIVLLAQPELRPPRLLTRHPR